MENKDTKVIELASFAGFGAPEETTAPTANTNNAKTTNPITKNFAKFTQRTKDKFSLKDIFK